VVALVMKRTHVARIIIVLLVGAAIALYWLHKKPMPLWQIIVMFLLLAPLAWFDHLRRRPLLFSIIRCILWTVVGAAFWVREHDPLHTSTNQPSQRMPRTTHSVRRSFMFHYRVLAV
jgi:hypothetical protein